MKLVELLARELKRWPHHCEVIAQDSDGFVMFWKYPDIKFEESEWNHPTGMGLCDGEWDAGIYNPCSDQTTAIVTRDQWQAERDRLTAAGEEIPPAAVNQLAGAQAEADTWEQRAVKEATRAVDLEAQRDELVAALERVVEGEFGFGEWPSEDELRDLIARAKGGTQ